MTQPLTPSQVDRAATYLRSRLSTSPIAAIILGSGLGPVADCLDSRIDVPYPDIPDCPSPSVGGHAGILSAGTLATVPVLAFRGRLHLYEGHHPTLLGLPVRLAHALGCSIVVVTNAAGGLRPEHATGDLMLLTDHIGLPGLAGAHPSLAWPARSDADRFVPMVDAYDSALQEAARLVAAEAGIRLHEGTYAMVAGPTYETPAEGRLLRALGADAVGMSTVPEVQVARQLGLRVLGISCITNAVAAPAGDDHLSVVEAASNAAASLALIIRRTLETAITID